MTKRQRSLATASAQMRASLLVSAGCSLAATGVLIAQMTVLSRVIARAFLARAPLAQLGPLLVLLLGLLLARAVLTWLAGAVALRGAIRAKLALRDRLLAHLLHLGPFYARAEQTGELATTAMEGAERMDAYLGRYLPQMVASVLTPLLILLYVFPLDWISAALLLLTAPLLPVLMMAAGSYAQRRMERQWSALSRMSAHFLDAVQGLPTLRLFGQAAAERARIAAVSEEVGRRTLSVLRVAFLSGFVLEFMTAVAIGLVAVTLGLRLLHGAIGFEQALLILLLTPEFYRPLRELSTARHAGLEGRTAAQRIDAILQVDAPHQLGAVPDRAPPLAQGQPGPPRVEVAGVSYTYAGATQPALCGVSLTLAPGTCTALVGPSGAGKSTLVSLLLRFTEPAAGSISSDGVPIAALSPGAWRQMVALVPQHPHLFYGSVRDNIALARPTASAREVARAAELAGAAEFIERLPRGYETPLGERGARLSAGEAHRLALARAFLKDAPLLVLDEPASSLDPLSERLVHDALRRLRVGRTVLVVAHRRATVAAADQIVVLEQGRVVESGGPAALLARRGRYAQLLLASCEVVG